MVLQRWSAGMNKRLDEALTRVKALADEHQQEAAELLFEYIEAREAGTWLTPEQVAEIERRLADDEAPASEEEVQAVFDRLTRSSPSCAPLVKGAADGCTGEAA
jgi:hypothetical protein